MWEFADDCLPDQNADFHGWDSGKETTAASFLSEGEASHIWSRLRVANEIKTEKRDGT